MITTVVTHEGKELKIVSQQYEIGLYVAIYENGKSIPEQMAFQVTEKELHEDIRNQKFFKKQVTVLEDQSSAL